MNDFTMVMACVAGVIAVAMMAFVMFNTYSGVHGSLMNAKVGEVFNFDYEQPLHGERHRVLAKVIEPVYALDETTIKRLNRRSNYRRNDPMFQRTKHIVVCKTADGEIRQFYAERATNVRRSPLGNFIIKSGIASLLF